ncbi:MAG TPA: NAD(P)-dependent oxidoreductase [Solirubrobacteraceae bacterium]|nr:NAD(P)-dependent oxidoreductase [Solirubrobacteraceae bacterium]
MTRRIVLTAAAAGICRAEFDALDDTEVVERYDLSDTTDGARIGEGIDGAWAVIAGSEPYGRATLAAARELRAILRWGTGSDAIDIPAATEAGVAVVTTPGANADAVADLALTLILACLRGLPELQAAVRSGAWRPGTLHRDLTGATVGIIGLGAIGRAVTRRLRGFDCRILAMEPHPDLAFCREYGVQPTDLHEALPQLDVVTLHAPLTTTTHHILGAEEIALLPPHAVLVNTSRGPLVDQAALTAALAGGAIAGAGLDVFEHEPLAADDPLVSLPNVITTGHVASFTRLGMGRIGEAVLANLRAVLLGDLPVSCLNPAAWGPAAWGPAAL